MVRLTKYKLFHGIGSVSTLAFIMLVLTLLLPIVSNGANAEGEVSDQASTRINISSSPVVSIALDKSVSLEFTPKVSGEFQQSSAKLTVSTNNTDGYRILLSSSNNNAALTSTSQTAKINSIVGMNVLPAAFTDNSWGYSLVNASTTPTSYNAVPTTDTEILNVETGKVIEGHADTYDLNFGARVSTSLPAGNYSGEVVVSAVANPIKLNSLMDVTYMQDMTHTICANTPILEDKKNPVTKQLIDTRDGKKYWVAKLADGNCWMVQNLALDIPATGLKAADTDITTDWNQENNQKYPPKATTTVLLAQDAVADPVSESDGVRSWDFGEWILIDPTRIGDEGCTLAVGQNFTSCNRLKAYDSETDDAHYLLGNYYQFNTAVAGSIGSNINIEATQSICPKNWKLPTSNNTNPGSIFYLLDQYGLTNIAINEGTGFSLASAPLFINREGDVNIRQPQLMWVGGSGGFWSGTAAYRPDYAYNLHLGRTVDYVQPSGNNNLGRMNGRSIRCLVR